MPVQTGELRERISKPVRAVIAKVVRGYRPAGLLAYLFGPGRHEEHRRPRVVAAWDGAPWLHQPDPLPPVVLDGEVVEPGEFALDLKQLAETMQAWPRLAGLPLSNQPRLPIEWQRLLAAGQALPSDAPSWTRCYRYDAKAQAVVLRPGYVWHCPVRLHPDDPVLTDEQWEGVAERLMRVVGIQQAGCRWVAVRHADDHIHLVATLVSEGTGKRFHPFRDYLRLREECRRLEDELGLRATAPADRTAVPAPTRQEKGKAERYGWAEPSRERLRPTVSRCAARASSGEEFFAELRRNGLKPHIVRGPDGRVRGYSVGIPGDVTRGWQPVRYAGRSLAPDLSWPRLLARWAAARPVPLMERNEHGRITPESRRAVIREATATVERVAAHVREAGGFDGVAHPAGELLSVLAEGHIDTRFEALTELARSYDRAARIPQVVLPVNPGSLGADLRSAVRQLAALGPFIGRGREQLATAALLLALAGLAAEIAAWHQLLRRPHQAAPAHTAARGLRDLVESIAPPPSAEPRSQVRPIQRAAASTLDRLGTWRGATTPGLPAPRRRL